MSKFKSIHFIQVLPQYKDTNEFYDENDDAFIDDSIIIEDPTLRTNAEEKDQPVTIDMNKYLVQIK